MHLGLLWVFGPIFTAKVGFIIGPRASGLPGTQPRRERSGGQEGGPSELLFSDSAFQSPNVPARKAATAGEGARRGGIAAEGSRPGEGSVCAAISVVDSRF